MFQGYVLSLAIWVPIAFGIAVLAIGNDRNPLPARRLAYLHLFSAVNKPDLTILELEDLVKRDVSLTMRVLRASEENASWLRRIATASS